MLASSSSAVGAHRATRGTRCARRTTTSAVVTSTRGGSTGARRANATRTNARRASVVAGASAIDALGEFAERAQAATANAHATLVTSRVFDVADAAAATARIESRCQHASSTFILSIRAPPGGSKGQARCAGAGQATRSCSQRGAVGVAGKGTLPAKGCKQAAWAAFKASTSGCSIFLVRLQTLANFCSGNPGCPSTASRQPFAR